MKLCLAQFQKATQAWLADDASAAGKIETLARYFDDLIEVGKRFGYLVNTSKSWLIVKSADLQQVAMDSFGDKVNITVEGKRHLGAAIGSEEFKQQYCTDLVTKWLTELELLCDVAESQPQTWVSSEAIVPEPTAFSF